MAAFAFALAASAAARVASLNLCSDEYLLLLAPPGQIVSVSKLAHDPQESVLAPLARRFPRNGGRLEDVLRFRPALVLTMGGGGRSTAAIARALGIRVLVLPLPASLDAVAANLRQVAAALGEETRAEPYLRAIAGLRATAPPSRDAIWVGGGGLSLAPDSLGSRSRPARLRPQLLRRQPNRPRHFHRPTSSLLRLIR